MRTATRLIGICIWLLFCGSAWADRPEHVTEKVAPDGAKNIEVEIDFGAGEIEVVGGDIEDVAELEIYYTPRWVAYEVDYQKRGETGHLLLESELRRKSGDRDLDNEWHIKLSRRYPCEFVADIGACEATLDLGGIPLTSINMDIGAASGILEFSEPNPERLREFDVEIGASSFELLDLGNANIELMTFSCGAASCELDFRGDFKGETELRLDVGVGSADVILPRGIGVRVEGDDGWFSSLDFHGLDLRKVDSDIWESDDFDDNENRIIIEVDVGMGSVDIYSKR